MISKKWSTEGKISLQSTIVGLQNKVFGLLVNRNKIVTIFCQQNFFNDFFKKFLLIDFNYLKSTFFKILK